MVAAAAQLLGQVQLLATPWTATRQASLSFMVSQSLLELMSIESVMPYTILSSVTPFSSFLQSFPESESFQMSQFFASGSQNIGASASVSVLLSNIQGWFPLGLTGLISLQFKGLSRVFYNTTVQKHQFFGTQIFLRSKLMSIHAAAAAAKSLQSCWTLCDPTDGSSGGSPIPGILQGRTLE